MLQSCTILFFRGLFLLLGALYLAEGLLNLFNEDSFRILTGLQIVFGFVFLIPMIFKMSQQETQDWFHTIKLYTKKK